MGWRYLAQRVTGEGADEFIDWDLPLTGVAITSNLSGPDQIKGTIDRLYERLVGEDGLPLLDPASTAIFAEADDEIRGGGFLVPTPVSGPQLSIDTVGYVGYAKNTYFDDSWYGVGVDPLDVVRRIFDHIQSQPGGNVGLELASTTSPVRIGTELENVDFVTGAGERVQFEAGPVKLNWWTTDDCLAKVDQLAKETPFDYRERHWWDSDIIRHGLDLGYPRLGRRRDDLRFELGVNISKIPTLSPADEGYANEVMVTGAGEGRDMIRSQRMSNRQPGQLRRVAQVQDKKITSVAQANERARYELSRRGPQLVVGEVTVSQHDNAQIGSWQVGDEVPIVVRGDWHNIDSWARIVSSTIYPDKRDIATIKVVRTDRGML